MIITSAIRLQGAVYPSSAYAASPQQPYRGRIVVHRVRAAAAAREVVMPSLTNVFCCFSHLVATEQRYRITGRCSTIRASSPCFIDSK